MSGFQIYIIMQLDIIHNVVLSILAVVIFAILVLAILLFTYIAGKNDKQVDKENVVSYLKKLFLVFIIILPFALFIPNTDTALMSSVVPKLNHPEKAKQVPEQFKEYVIERLEDLDRD